jgi:hypothetical protein
LLSHRICFQTAINGEFVAVASFQAELLKLEFTYLSSIKLRFMVFVDSESEKFQASIVEMFSPLLSWPKFFMRNFYANHASKNILKEMGYVTAGEF